MTVDVTAFIQNLTKNNAAIEANVNKGVSTATAFFGALQDGQLNASTLLNSSSLSAADRSKAENFINGGIDTSAIDRTLAGTGVTGSGTVATTQITNTGPDAAITQTFTQGVNRIILDQPDIPKGTSIIRINENIPVLLQNEVRALMVQIGYIASNWESTKTNYDTGQLGRYQVTKRTLINYGYRFTGNTDFTGKDGISFDTEFLFDANVQDRVMERFIQDQYRALIKVGAIRDFDSKEYVAGMIAVAYQFQDAVPGLGDIDTSGLLGSISGSTDGLTSLLATSCATLSKSTSVLSSSATMNSTAAGFGESAATSGVFDSLSSLTPELLAAAKSGDPAAAKSLVDASGLESKMKTLGTTTADGLKSQEFNSFSDISKDNLPASLTGMQDQAKLAAAKIDVAALKSSASDFTSSIPASKANKWRNTGVEQDSSGRPGSLFFNAGRYAIQVLSADITTG